MNSQPESRIAERGLEGASVIDRRTKFDRDLKMEQGQILENLEVERSKDSIIALFYDWLDFPLFATGIPFNKKSEREQRKEKQNASLPPFKPVKRLITDEERARLRKQHAAVRKKIRESQDFGLITRAAQLVSGGYHLSTLIALTKLIGDSSIDDRLDRERQVWEDANGNLWLLLRDSEAALHGPFIGNEKFAGLGDNFLKEAVYREDGTLETNLRFAPTANSVDHINDPLVHITEDVVSPFVETMKFLLLDLLRNPRIDKAPIALNSEKLAEQTGISVEDVDFIKSRSRSAFQGNLSRKLVDVLNFDANDPRRKQAMDELESSLHAARVEAYLESQRTIVPAP